MGSVLEVYWHFSEPSDQYLGRILSGLDHVDATFEILPPHYTMIDPKNNIDAKRAVIMMHRLIIEGYKDKEHDPSALLYRYLASVVYHSDKLIQVIITCSGHDFSKIPILHDKTLLQRLKVLVTIDKTEGVLANATGIPPHIETAVKLQVSSYFT